MKHAWKRLISLLLSVALLCTLVVPAFAENGAAAESEPSVTWEKVEGAARRAPARVSETAKAQPRYADDELVRVSIVLEDASTLGMGFSTKRIADNANAMNYRDSLKAKQVEMAQTISGQVLGGAALDVVWNITLAANIISANVPYGKLDAIRALDGVKDVVLEAQYAPDQTVEEGDSPNMYRAALQTGSDKVWDEGITGAGSRVAVIDTGIETDHQSFQENSYYYSLQQNAIAENVDWEAYLASLNLLTSAEVASKADQLNVTIDPATTYVSAKIPYAYNYVDLDYDVTHRNDTQGNHGSHVEGIAAANKYVASGTGFVEVTSNGNKIKGQAYDAQILTMKVFGKGGGAFDSDYMVAIEDAIVLGCDSVNLSLGSSSAGFATDETYQSILDSLVQSDTVVSISMGNSYQWSYAAGGPSRNIYYDDANYFTGGSPGSFANAFTVASVGSGNVNTDGRYSMSSFSSWGVPSDLSLKPEITAPGGNIISVNGNNTTGYTNMSGTSMAAPQITGITALVGQYLRESGLLEKTGVSERKLAQSLIMSTAVPIHMTNNSFIYYPVIQQGAGLARTDKAIAAKTYVMIDPDSLPARAPLSAKSNALDGKVKVELGDDPDHVGVYSFAFTLNNLTDQDVIYALDADFFTQNITGSGNNRARAQTIANLVSNNTWTVDGTPIDEVAPAGLFDLTGDGTISALDAQAILELSIGKIEALAANADKADLDGNGEVNTYDAYLYVQKLNAAQNANGKYVTVPANGSVRVGLTFDLKDSIEAYNYNGNYVEGYVNAREVVSEGEGVDHSIPVLGYYGSWTDPSMFNKGSYLAYTYGGETRVPYLNNVLGSDTAKSLQTFLLRYAGQEFGSPIGGNPVIRENYYQPERNAVSSIYGDEINTVHYSAIRNSAASRFRVMQEGVDEPISEILSGYAYGAYYNTNDGSWYNTNAMPDLNYKLPETVANNAKLTLSFELAPEYYVKSDGSIDWDALHDGAKLTLPVTVDNEEPAITDVSVATSDVDGSKKLLVTAADNQYIAAIYISTESGTELLTKGSDPNAQPGDPYTVSVPLPEDESRLLVEVYDYAMNVGTYRLNFNKDELVDPVITMTLDRTDFEIINKNSTRLTATVLPWGVDDEVTWTTSDPTVATVNGRGVVTGVETGEATITATSVKYPDVSATATVHVRFIEKTLNGIVCDENGAAYVIEFTMRDLPTYKTLHEEPLEDWVYETAIDKDGTVYVSTYDGSNPSPLYTLDLATMTMTKLGNGTSRTYYTDIDVVGDALYDRNILVGVYSTNLYTINKTNGSRASNTSMRSYTGNASLIGISFYKTVDNTDHFFVLTQNGIVYDVGLSVVNNAVSVVSSEQVLDFGYTADINYWQDLYFDGESLFWSRIDLGISRVDLIMAENFAVEDKPTNIINGGSFAVDVWPVGGLFELSKVPGYTPPDPEPGTGADGSLNAASGEAPTLPEGSEYLTVELSEEIMSGLTNGRYTVKYDPALLSLADVTANGKLDAVATAEAEGEIKLAFAEGDNEFTDGDFTFTLSFTTLTDNFGKTEVTVTKEELNQSNPDVIEVYEFYGNAGSGAPVPVYGEPVFQWSEDLCEATATFTSTNTEDVQTLLAIVTCDLTKEPTCTEAGEYTYTATVIFQNEAYTDTKTEVIEAHGHCYDEDWTWAEDYSNAQVTLTCSECDLAPVTLDASVQTEIVLEPTYEYAGYVNVTLYAEYEGEDYVYYILLDPIPQLVHTYGEPVWSWSADGTFAAATFTSNDNPDVVDVQRIVATITGTRTDPTYDAEGVVTNTATVVFLGETYTDVVTNVIPKLEYTYGEPTWNWLDGFTAATATFPCVEDEANSKVVVATITTKILAEATCVSAGTRTITATVNFGGKTYAAQQAEVIAAAGHKWNNGETTAAPSCTAKGIKAFTCTVCNETRVEAIDAAGHKSQNVAAVAATCTSAGSTAGTKCSVCGAIITGCETVPAKGHTITAIAAVPATCIAGGKTEGAKCSVCNEVIVAQKDVAALGHSYGAAEITKAPTAKAEGELTITCARCGDKKTESIAKLGGLGLELFIAVAKELETANCTEESAAALAAAITAAEAALETATTQAALDEALTGLLEAIEGLEENAFQFDDVKDPEAYYYDAVYWAFYHEPQVTTGTSDTTFGPGKDVTRGQAVTFLWRAAGEPKATSSNNPFEDVKESAFYYDAVLWAVEKGITTGTSSTKFTPNGTCTKAHIITFIWRWLGEPAATGASPFTDVTESNWYYKSALWANENGLVDEATGVTADKFNPLETCTRGATVTFLYRASEG